MKVTVSHSGKQHAYQHALSIQRLGCLHRFVTSTYYRRDSWPDRVAGFCPPLDMELRKRWLKGLDSRRVTRSLRFEIPELWHRRVRRDRVAAELAMFQRDSAFDAWVAERFATESDIFWGFQGSCLASLKAAREAHRLAVCEFATAHVRAAIRILTQEAERHPEWAGTISNLHFPDWYVERLEKEPHAAELCVAASGFTKQSLLEVGIPEDDILVLPLGADVEQFRYAPRRVDQPLKILFVGGIGQRKGIKYLLEAVQQLGSSHVELCLLGPLPADTSVLDQFSSSFTYLGQTDQAGVVRHMHEADLLVLPSVFEGFGLVIIEAMATGMPVIASTHSVAPEVIDDGVHGFVLEPDDVQGLAEKLDWAASHRSELCEMGAQAGQRAREFSWEAHTTRLGRLLAEIAERYDLSFEAAFSPAVADAS